MAQAEQLSLSWDAHQKSICNGLSALQQRGEFVDMTLAADGHHVKVHQLVLSLVSPYIKDLISSAACPHPIIFLNNISYTTLCAILEYIYTGEALVPKNKLGDLIAAGKALHIRGLREMDDTKSEELIPETTSTPSNTSISEKLRVHREKQKRTNLSPAPIHKIYLDETNGTQGILEDTAMDTLDDFIEPDDTSADPTSTLDDSGNLELETNNDELAEVSRKTLSNKSIQYTVSNQGGLQAIYNRYVYQLRYIGIKNRHRSWRCVDYNSTQCPANMFTDENDVVINRTCVHNHPFHDDRILKKCRIVNKNVQYSVSNQGGIQAIHNRYIYYLRYVGKKNCSKFWRCMDYSTHFKCPANICTDENNQVIRRSFTHVHPFHDSKILKKLHENILYTDYHKVETKSEAMKKYRNVRV